MLTSADKFTFPDGSEYAVISSPANPDSEPLVMEMVCQPECLAPSPHVHSSGSDTFEVLEGSSRCEPTANGTGSRPGSR